MRHEKSLGPSYFEKIYAGDPDPWQFETSAYERAKYDRTLKLLPRDRFERVLEIGCANGVLTERLAKYCDLLIAVDIVEGVLERARWRCASLPNVIVQNVSIPSDEVSGPFDLILLSEVAYYWDSGDIIRAGAYFTSAIEVGGYLMLVHWTGETDYPKSADDAVRELTSATKRAFTEIFTERHPNYRLDIWQRQNA